MLKCISAPFCLQLHPRLSKKKKLNLLQQSFDLSSREQSGTDYFSISICWVPF